MVTTKRDLVMERIEAERLMQVRKGWTPEHDQTHTFSEWLAILTKQQCLVVEALSAAIVSTSRLEQALTRLAAVAVAWQEAMD